MDSGVRPTGSTARSIGSAPIVYAEPHWAQTFCCVGGFTKPHLVHCMGPIVTRVCAAEGRHMTRAGESVTAGRSPASPPHESDCPRIAPGHRAKADPRGPGA